MDNNNTLTIPIQKQAYRMFLDNDVDFAQFLVEHEVASSLNALLLDYHMSDGGSPSVRNVEIEFNKSDFSFNSNKGQLFLSYVVDYYYSCDDMNNSIDADITLDVTFDKNKLEFTFHGPIQWKLNN